MLKHGREQEVLADLTGWQLLRRAKENRSVRHDPVFRTALGERRELDGMWRVVCERTAEVDRLGHLRVILSTGCPAHTLLFMEDRGP